MTEHQNDIRTLNIRGKDVGEFLDSLKPGGPAVDEPALLAYVVDRLDDTSRRHVETMIVTWRAWHDAYWKILHDVQYEDAILSGIDVQPSAGEETSPPIRIAPPRSRIPRRVAIACASAAALMLIIAVATFRANPKSILVTSSPISEPSRGGDPLTLKEGVYRLSSPYFHTQVRSNQTGFLTVFIVSDSGRDVAVFPLGGRPRLPVKADQVVENGPFLCESAAVEVWTVVTDDDATAKIRNWTTNVMPATDAAKWQADLTRTLAKSGTRSIGISTFRVEHQE